MERIHVAVRARPLTAEDAGSSPWRVSGNAIALSTQPSIRFEFDRIFGEECRTADVYGARTKHIVDSAVRGFNGTVFAYGQTNSGKTYTMRGSGNEPGIIPLAVHDLFRTIEEHLDREFLLRMSYMEIYNEEINDLLVPEHRKLQIHESIERGIYVAGLREEIVTCPEQVLEFMSFGESHRHIGETNMNVYSSRSHTIFRMVIESREKVDESEAGESCDAVRVSVLNLVDLAGSERAAKTGAEGVRLKEGSHINKSLMTLGTVIKKLSEGIEGQGGHVPYRDSKLTRILQPALGGNANTAIICNITLAQVHADETKSSLQFASRALRVTNCACVNEILTDAALLKRQRKEIEELRAKLRNSQSEHWEEEILNLRNTLLQSELEKERISLELEEEKKAKEQRDKRLIEQAKKIENLSSLVLNSERDDRTTVSSKNKRRLTWCPGLLSRQFDGQVLESVQEDPPSSTVRHGRNMEMPLHFEELIQESCESSIKHYTDAYSSGSLSCEDDSLPDSHALLHVTSRRKPNTMKKSDQEQLMGLASERIIPQELNDWKYTTQSQENIKACVNGLSARESEAILVIKQLEDQQIKLLELEKSSFQNNLDDVLELATQQKASFHEKYEELQQNALVAQEQAKIANEKLSKQEAAYEFLTGIFVETESIAVQMDQSTRSVDNALSFIEELFQNLFMMAKNFTEAKQFVCGDITQFSSVIRDYENISNCLREKLSKLEMEKKILDEQSLDQKDELQRLKSSLESCEKAMEDCNIQNELEKDSILSELLTLQKEVVYLSSSSLMKEKESIRKELDRTKTKLKETENKLKNSIQEKIKLESEKAEAQREIKKLQSQRTLLERDLRKRDSFTVDKRHEQNVKSKELAGIYDQAVQIQEDYGKLEMHAFDMEAEIASLQEALVTTIAEKEEALSRVELLTSAVEDLESRLNSAESETSSLLEETAVLTRKLDASESISKKLEASISSLSREKEDMGIELTDVLLEMESERSTWTAKEKAYLEAKQKLNICNENNCKLSEDLIKVRQELVCCREQYSILEAKMIFSKNDTNEEKYCRETFEESERLLKKERNIDTGVNENLIQAKATIDELSSRISIVEAKMKNDASAYNKENTKLRMQIRWMQPELDAHRGRLKEAINEMKLMDTKYLEASTKLKKDLSFYCREVLRLKEQLKESQVKAT
ncbi:kinesin-like protein KIN-7I isoform X2 [Oryza glaberrima]|uniref:kinesin-like protein KIN-7I isoform X2 n=1 Tax=Oryza glaberrima TaxID=4538 RepID=UPI00224C28CA|nr:kinesin-like protein KIN-7I isoform X2 [Oryza glaberrima]